MTAKVEEARTSLALLLQEGMVSAADVTLAKKNSREAIEPAVAWLLANGRISEEDLYFLLTSNGVAQTVPEERLLNLSLSTELRRRCPKWLAARFLFVPLDLDAQGTLSVVLFDPTDGFAIERLALQLGVTNIRTYLARRSSILAAVEAAYGSGGATPDPVVLEMMRQGSKGGGIEASETQVELIPGKVSLDPSLFREMAEADPSMAQESLRSRVPRGGAQVVAGGEGQRAPAGPVKRLRRTPSEERRARQSPEASREQLERPVRERKAREQPLRGRVQAQSLIGDEDLTQVAVRLPEGPDLDERRKTMEFAAPDAPEAVGLGVGEAAKERRAQAGEGRGRRSSHQLRPQVKPARRAAELPATFTSAKDTIPLVAPKKGGRGRSEPKRREDTVRTQHPAALDPGQQRLLAAASHAAVAVMLDELAGEGGKIQRYRFLGCQLGTELELPQPTIDALATASGLVAYQTTHSELGERDVVQLFTEPDQEGALSPQLKALGAACLGLAQEGGEWRKTVASEVVQVVVDYASLSPSEADSDMETVAQLLRAGGVDSLLIEALVRMVHRLREAPSSES